MLLNTAGEPEREAWSRRANLIEAVVMMLVLLAALWGVAYPFGVVMGFASAGLATRILIAALGLFALVISPWLHRDTLRSRGLGSPRALLRGLRRRTARQRLFVGGIISVGATILTVELYRNASGTTRFAFGVEPAMTINLKQTFGGEIVLLALCAALSFLWFTCIVRYDNFRPALRVVGGMLAVLLPLTVLAGWAANGADAFARAKAWNLLRDGLGYIFWGAVQQLVFCSYFGTRLRKSFAPARRPEARAWKRLGVAALNGLFFGVVHMSNWLLAGFAWVLGVCLSWAFMKDRYRNLQALGLVHGALGTCILWLFAQAGDTVTIRLRVGPWAMPHRWDPITLTVAGCLLLGLALGLLLASRRRPVEARDIAHGRKAAEDSRTP